MIKFAHADTHYSVNIHHLCKLPRVSTHTLVTKISFDSFPNLQGFAAALELHMYDKQCCLAYSEMSQTFNLVIYINTIKICIT